MEGIKHEEQEEASATWRGQLDVRNCTETDEVIAEWATLLCKYWYTTTVLSVLLIWSYFVITISITLSNFYEFRKVSAFRFPATLDITAQSTAISGGWL
jgi:hypothetical protein